MIKKISLKLLSIIAAISVMMSVFIPITGLISLALDSSSLPENTVAVLDEEGMENTLGDMSSAQLQWIYGRFYKKALKSVDFTSAENVEFDISFSNYTALNSFMDSNGVHIEFSLTSAGKSSGDIWVDRSTCGDIRHYLTYVSENQYHAVIPKSSFETRYAGGVDWSKVDTWLLIGEGNSATIGALYTDTIKISNICATRTPDGAPDMPSDAIVVLDKSGMENTIGDYWNYMWDRMHKPSPTAADFSTSDFIEFDVYYSDFPALSNALIQKSISFIFNLSSSKSQWIDRSFTGDIFAYETKIINEWHHYKIPKSAFAGSADWTKINYWMFGFEGSSDSTGSLKDLTVKVRNICGTMNKPMLPGNVIAVIDGNGIQNTIGDQYAYLCDRLWNKVDSVDISKANYIEFDVQYDDFIGLSRATDVLGIDLIFNLSSSGSQWSNRYRCTNINRYATAGNNGWYHYKMPIANFESTNTGDIDWTKIDVWMLAFDGANIRTDAGAYKGENINVKNVCATYSEENELIRPALNSEALYVLDQLGVLGKLGNTSDTKYSDISKTFVTENIINGNITASKKLSMQIYIDDIGALPKNLSISFGVKSDGKYRYLNEIEISNQITTNGWNEVVIPVSAVKTDNLNDLKNIASWKLSSNDNTAVGDKKDCRLFVCNIIGVLDATAADMPENAVVVMDEAGKESIIGSQYAELYDRLYKNTHAVDFSNAHYVEFDLHFEDYIALARELDKNGLRFTFSLTSSGKQWTNRVCADYIERYCVKGENGWYHFKIPKSVFVTTNNGDIDWKNINLWMLGFEGDGLRADCGAFSKTVIRIMNVCGTPKSGNELFRPNLSFDRISLIDQLGVIDTMGENAESGYDKISDKFVSESIVNGNLSGSKYISMQVFVDNIAALPKNLTFSFGVNEEGAYKYLNEIEILTQIVSSGWNEIIFPISSVSENSDDLKNIVTWRVSSTDKSVVGKNKDCRFFVCNIIGIVDATAPELPSNIVTLFNFRGLSNTPGGGYSWLGDRMYQQDLGPFDISDCDFLEFDFYLEDFDVLNRILTEKDSPVDKLLFGISSGDSKKYSQSRYFYRSVYSFFNQVKKSGWNHIKVPISEMYTYGDGGSTDLSSVTSFMLCFDGKNVMQATSEEIANLTFKIINVCATSVRPIVKIPYDGAKPVRPDSSAVYINDAENTFDSNGTWNPASVTISTNYKTEGNSSIQNILFDQPLRANQLRWLFNKTANFSDIGMLKFDFFIKDVDLLRQRTEMSVIISSNSRGTADYYSWKLDLYSLKDGWNSITVNTSKDFKISGNPDLSKVKSVAVQCDKADFKSDEYKEKVVIGIDNLRYISKTNSTTLRINSEESFDKTDDMYESEADDDDGSEFLGKKPTPQTETHIVKKQINNTVTRFLLMTILLIAELVAVSVSVLTIYLIRKKINRKL